MESSAQSIPYHIQVNICHDITLALSFLHSNNLIHRDLSSNNVLLTKDASRAKVTDFGMTQLYDLNPHRSNTMCPGTAVYMPPEALQDRPRYSEKIDCFSFGVIVLQVLTQQFPDPEAHQKQVEVNHPALPRGQLMVCVPEVDRRRNHISLVDRNHPILPIILDCLRDNEGERPTAKQICERVAILKGSSEYGESEKVGIQQVKGLQQLLRSQMQRLDEKDDEIQRLRRELHAQFGGEKDQRIAQLYQVIEYRDQAVAKKSEEIERQRSEIKRLRLQLEQAVHNYRIIQQQDGTIAEKQREIEALQWQLEQANLREKGKDEANSRIVRQKEQAIAQKQRENEQLAELLRQATLQAKEKDERIAQLSRGREQAMTRKDQEILLLRQQIQRSTLQDRAVEERKRHEPSAYQMPLKQARQVQMWDEQPVNQRQVQQRVTVDRLEERPNTDFNRRDRPPENPLEASNKVVPLADIKLRWEEGPQVSVGMKRASNACSERTR